MAKYQHLLLTRFNVPDQTLQNDKHGCRVLTTEWLEHRIMLFERFCFPSVAAQSCRNFTWLVLFDSASPAWFRGHLEKYRSFDRFMPLFIPDIEERIEAILTHVDADAEFLITTRMDNDDAIHRDMIREVQGHFHGQERIFLNFPQGYLLCHDTDLYHAWDRHNPFISMIEKRRTQPFQTVWCCRHTKGESAGKVMQIDDRPRWLRVIHHRNAAPRDPSLSTSMRNLSRRGWLARRFLAKLRVPRFASNFLTYKTQRRLVQIENDFQILKR